MESSGIDVERPPTLIDGDTLFEVHRYHCMNAQAREAFRFLVSVVNVQAFDEGSKLAVDAFLPWDPLEDLMPYFSYTARAYILGRICEYIPPKSFRKSHDLNEEAFDEMYKSYAGELCKDLHSFDVTVHDPVLLPDCLPTPRLRGRYLAKECWMGVENVGQKIVGYVDFESFEKRVSHSQGYLPCGGSRGDGYTVSFELVIPLLYIEDLTSHSTTAAVEALMPNNGSTVVRVEDLYLPAWKGMVVEFESFAALDETMKTHARKPFVLLGGILETDRPPSPPD